MAIAAHVFRRGAIYYWRRRMPKTASGPSENINHSRSYSLSLGTRCPKTARFIAVELTALSERMFMEFESVDWGSAEQNAVFNCVVAKLKAKLSQTRCYLSEHESEDEFRRNEVLAAKACGIAADFAAKKLEKGDAEQQIRSLTEREEKHGGLLRELEKVDSEWFDVEQSVRQACLDTGVEFRQVISVDGQMHMLAKRQVHLETARHGRYGSPGVRASQDVEFADLLFENQERIDCAGKNPMERPQKCEPVAPLAGAIAENETPIPSSLLFSEVAVAVVDDLQIDGTHNLETCDQIKATGKLLDLLLPDTDASRFTQADCAKFKSLLRAMPKIYGRTGLADDWQKAADIAHAGTGEGLANSTINRHLSHANKLIAQGVKRGLNVAPVRFLDLSIPKSKRKKVKNERKQFDQADIAAIFNCAPFTGARDAKHRFDQGQVVIHDSTMWVPLIAFYSGARKTEICKIALDDVYFECEVPYIHIRDNKFGDLKNESSDRIIPIHRELIRLGFVEFVKISIETGREVLFPELIGGAETYGPGDCYYKNGWAKLIKIAGIDDKAKVFHSFRHTVITKLGNSQIDDHFRKRVVGHAKESESENRYTKEQCAIAAQHVIEAIQVVTSHLSQTPIKLGTRTTVPRRQPRQNQ